MQRNSVTNLLTYEPVYGIFLPACLQCEKIFHAISNEFATPVLREKIVPCQLKLDAVFRAGDSTTTSRDEVRNVSHPRGQELRRKTECKQRNAVSAF